MTTVSIVFGGQKRKCVIKRHQCAEYCAILHDNIAMSDIFCCLCLEELPADRRRRKKLHGASCAALKRVLLKLAPFPLDELCGKDAVLCSNCQGAVGKIVKLQEKVEALEQSIVDKLRLASLVSSIPPNAKRVCPDPGVFTSTRVSGLIDPPIALSSSLVASPANLPSTGVMDTGSPDSPLSADVTHSPILPRPRLVPLPITLLSSLPASLPSTGDVVGGNTYPPTSSLNTPLSTGVTPSPNLPSTPSPFILPSTGAADSLPLSFECTH